MLGPKVLPKWVLYSASSSLLCILGSFMVPIVVLLSGSHHEVNSRLLNYGLSLSAGSMLCTSLLKMLGATDRDNDIIVFLGFLTGCFISFVLNYIVHSYTSQSLVHCAHQNENGDIVSKYYEEPVLTNLQSHSHSHLESHKDDLPEQNNSHASDQREVEHGFNEYCLPTRETDHLLSTAVKTKPSTSLSEYQVKDCIPIARTTTRSSLPIIKCLGESKPPTVCLEPNIGYDLENLAIYREQFMMKGDASMDGHSDRVTILYDTDHKHVLETPFSKLLSIGIQTCLVICLHKFPEGFIIFYTNSPDEINDGRPDLGFSIFLSLAVHNFIEGFAMTLPLFTALETKWHALIITIILGGGSQPLGAFLGMEWYKHSSSEHSPEYAQAKMDFLLSITSGFLFVISLQMFQTAVAFSDTHHHHEGQDETTIRKEHSAGTTCLKFCCLGVLLILASSALQTR